MAMSKSIEEHRTRIDEIKKLIYGAQGKRKHDLQVHLYRLEKQLRECQQYLKENKK